MSNVRKISWLVFALFASDALAQIGYPGGGYPPGGGRYPGGGIPGGGPGIPMPRRGKQSKSTTKEQDSQQQLVTVTGMLRALNDKQVIVEATDHRIINLKRSEKTKFMKDGDDMKPSFFTPGDHVQVEANQDKEGFLYAVNVIFEKEGTAAERAEASQPVQVSTQASEGSDDDERPRMRRADSPAPPSAGDPPAPPEPPAPRSAPKPAPPQVASDEPLAPAAPDPDDPGPPTLRRGIPAKQKQRPNTVEVASAKVPAPAPVHADAAPRRPEPLEPDAAPQDPVIEKAKDVAESFTETLPNYICQQFTARFVNTSHITSWQAQDGESAEVVYENGRESYRNLQINGKPIKKGMEELSGSWSTGEFGTLLRDLFSPATAAAFRYRKDSLIAGMTAALYDFSVERDHSHWRVQVASQSMFPAYKGSVWIEKKSGRVLRIEMQTRNMPSEFPLDKVETAADYEYVRIGGVQQFLLPVHSETLSCQRGTNMCSRNAIDFRNYKKYSGEASITFDK